MEFCDKVNEAVQSLEGSTVELGVESFRCFSLVTFILNVQLLKFLVVLLFNSGCFFSEK